MPADRRKVRTIRHAQIRKTTVAESSTVWEQVQNQQPKPEEPQTIQTGGKAGMTKKQKQILRRDALKQRLGIAGSPYSKSHKKRLKRKAKGQLITDLKAVEQAIADVDTEILDTHGNASSTRQSQIGEGKHSSLTAKQRQRTFQIENMRHKLVLQTPEFASNPFRTIRTHAQNTLVKHQ